MFSSFLPLVRVIWLLFQDVSGFCLVGYPTPMRKWSKYRRNAWKRRFQKCDTGARVVQHGPCRGTCRRWKTWQTSNTTRPPVLYNTDRVVSPEGVDFILWSSDLTRPPVSHNTARVRASGGKISIFRHADWDKFEGSLDISFNILEYCYIRD